MCGIAGQFNFGNGAPVSAEVLARMAGTMIHRGPDDEGFHLDGNLGLGFRRLSIIDLAAGHQPMSDDTGRVWIVFNGEIYNFRELRAELESKGHLFRTRSDTEVIVHGYRQWGDGILNRLNGMFGLAIWDVERRRLLLARDPMGIKPLYYRLTDKFVLFGSEIRSILAVLPEKPGPNPLGINLFLRYRYTPAPYTAYRDIYKLAPGQALIVENGVPRLNRYYRFRPDPSQQPTSDEEATEQLVALYKAAVRRHLISDVPLGLLLSGGIDSALLLALMSLYGKEWPTFTVGYGHTFRDDELEDAAETARLFGARHTAVRIDQQTFESALPRIVEVLEEPVASSSIVPMYFVSERARLDVKVALVGQGPDEVFGGYTRHLGVRYGAAWRSVPGIVRGPLMALVRALPRNEALKRGVGSLAVEQRLRRYAEVFSLAPGGLADSLFREGVLTEDPEEAVLDCWSDLTDQMADLDELGGFQLLEVRSSLPDELLMYVDKMSMAHSLEIRVPYLDREVVEYSQQLDSRFKIRRGKGKWLHRRVCRQFLPQTILARPKRGFAVNVVDDWFRASVGGKMEEILMGGDSAIYSLLDRSSVSRLIREHRSRRHDHHKLLFSLVVLEQWLRNGN